MSGQAAAAHQDSQKFRLEVKSFNKEKKINMRFTKKYDTCTNRRILLERHVTGPCGGKPTSGSKNLVAKLFQKSFPAQPSNASRRLPNMRYREYSHYKI
ncbi:hypothetical protein TNCV_1245371 [Trichonephila clavipes]|nr:hypothetical protein TNCV_1245371 [Trichonephila clavipes]